MQKLAILGSTGSIGQSALGLVDLYPERFEVVALAANRNSELLFEQAAKYHPSLVALHDQDAATQLRQQLPATRVAAGAEGLVEVSCHTEATVVLSSIMGAAGLLPTYHAIEEGKKIALANKETLVMAGELLVGLARQRNSQLLPVDSEHSALHQCLRGAKESEVRRLLLTASGGPFVDWPRDAMTTVTVEQALDHPTWDMGPKITIDSATLMNKGLEVLEAKCLFGVTRQMIEVVIHPQSIIHSMVAYRDGSVMAQLGIPDMKGAIAYALSYPQRLPLQQPLPQFDATQTLTFQQPDLSKFPCLALAFKACEVGGTLPAVLNAANEVAVHAFLDRQIGFVDLEPVIRQTIEAHAVISDPGLPEILSADQWARGIAQEVIKEIAER